MPLLRQLEFAFRSTIVAGIVDPGRFCASQDAGVTDSGYSDTDRNPNLETKAQELLRDLGAARIAEGLRVEWNSRLKTAAGRADYRQKLVSLNPRLFEHPDEIDRTLRHELAHILAQFRVGHRRILPHGEVWRTACRDLGIAGEKRCHNLPFAARTLSARFVYRCPKCLKEFLRVRRIRRTVACLACCRKHNGGDFDPRFRLRLSTTQHVVIPSASERSHPR
jgi:predicted SprT family Zn-dependent metalloprotease